MPHKARASKQGARCHVSVKAKTSMLPRFKWKPAGEVGQGDTQIRPYL